MLPPLVYTTAIARATLAGISLTCGFCGHIMDNTDTHNSWCPYQLPKLPAMLGSDGSLTDLTDQA